MALTTDPDKRLARALGYRTTFDAWHDCVTETQQLTRQEVTGYISETENRKYVTMRSSRALDILMMFSAFMDTEGIKFHVPPVGRPSQKEDEITSGIELALTGVPDALVKHCGRAYNDCLINGAEGGWLLLGKLFNADWASDGEFPFQVIAPDPLASSWFPATGIDLQEFFILEDRQAGELLEVLESARQGLERYGGAGKWAYPKKNNQDFMEWARENPGDTVECGWIYDEESEFLYIERTCVWQRPHNMPSGVPFVVSDLRGTPSLKPEERGRGLVRPVMGSLKNQELLFDTLATDADFMHRPPAVEQTPDGWRAVQIAPGASGKGSITHLVVPQVDWQFANFLMQRADSEIGRGTYPDMMYQGVDNSASGLAIKQGMIGPNQTIEKQRNVPEMLLRQHFSGLLKDWEFFCTPAMAKQHGAKWETWKDAFSVLVQGKDPATKELRPQKVTLTGDDIAGHYSVYVNLAPSVEAEQSAKFQQFQIAVTSGMPVEWAAREILEVKNPEEFARLYTLERLRASNPVVAAFLDQLDLDTLLGENKEMFKKWQLFCSQNGIDPETMQPIPQAPAPPPPEQGAMPPSGVGQQAMLPPGPLPGEQPMNGIPPSMVSPAEAGMEPTQEQLTAMASGQPMPY